MDVPLTITGNKYLMSKKKKKLKRIRVMWPNNRPVGNTVLPQENGLGCQFSWSFIFADSYLRVENKLKNEILPLTGLLLYTFLIV
jgi:hypothetical protein